MSIVTGYVSLDDYVVDILFLYLSVVIELFLNFSGFFLQQYNKNRFSD